MLVTKNYHPFCKYFHACDNEYFFLVCFWKYFKCFYNAIHFLHLKIFCKLFQIQYGVYSMTGYENTITTYQCQDCFKIFKKKSDFIKHRYTHTGEKPYQCHLCDYKSTQSSNLKTHIWKKHEQHNEQHTKQNFM